ncbi:hypothetical protein [Flavobacterium gilvum]|uniref:Uncharacterized protein n=1 Tax=Flavobacterium gilvum TaxID=1492737 RepID=A0AAC9I7V9_9FLAO|nr:hypothetical protein [Flavobacterium gilvum]AOW10986.1 hypothetical protein EM308_16675 [Flavobacterium gilvum]KFC58128.1 hypothetical protein FEM08_30830 [Flavobacterium gilvum]
MKIKGLTFIFVIALLITIWINFIDYKFSVFVLFANKTKNVESLLDNFCLSYIAGYFFYFINVYLLEREDKKHILPLISEKVYHIILVNKTIIKVMKQDNDFNKFNITLEEFRLLLKKDNFEATNSFLTANGNKVLDKFIKERRKGTLQLINDILKTGKFVDDELKSIFSV